MVQSVKRVIALSGFFAIFAIQAEVSFVQKVAEKNLASFGWEEDDWDANDMSSFLNEHMKRRLNPTAKGKRTKAFSLYKGYERNEQFQNTVLLDQDSTWSDLTLFCGQADPALYVAAAISRTHTELGNVALYLQIASPINDSERLKKRQRTIQTFVNNPALMQKFDELLAALPLCENIFLSFYHNDHLRNSVNNLLEFSVQKGSFGESLNKSYLALESKNIAGHAQRGQWLVAGAVSTAALLLYGMLKLVNVTPPDPLPDWVNDSQGGPWTLSRFIWNSNLSFLKTALALGMGAWGLTQLRGQAQWMADCFLLEKCVHQITTQLALFITNGRRLSEELAAHPELACFDEFKNVVEFFKLKIQESPQVNELAELLASDTFKSPYTVFANRGHYIRAFTLMHEVKDELKTLAAGIGKLDAYLSLAKLVKEFEAKRVHFCFPNYEVAQQPSVRITDFWHPLLDSNSVVANSLTLGGLQRQNMIVTGPNAGGKSTILKTVTLSILLAQTIGIAPARSMSFTPFSAIKTYLNIVDDLGAGNSLFMAEAKQAQLLIDRVESQANNEFSFTCFDEVFNGTSQIEGSAAAYSVAYHLAPFKNNICVIATHFPLLTQLENDTVSFKNYKVSVNQNNGRLSYPFKLEEGISYQHVALDVLRQQGFAGSMLEKAQSMVNLLQKSS